MDARLVFRVLVLLLTAVALAGCAGVGPGEQADGDVITTGVSNDGQYAITAHDDNRLVLWNIAERKHRIISTNANIYSAYWVDGRHAFMWQELDNVVHVQSVTGDTLKRFEHFPTYGHVIGPNIETYVASNQNWQLYIGDGANQRPIKKDGEGPSFTGIGKLLNLTLDTEQQLLLSSGRGLAGHDNKPITKSPPIEADTVFSDYAGVVLWQLPEGEPVHKLPGNRSKVDATISPDGEYVVGVDENTQHHVWDTSTGEDAYKVSHIGSGLYQPADEGLGSFDSSGVRVDFPEDFEPNHNKSYVAVQFLDDNHYAAFHNQEQYASLWKLGDPFALKFLDLGAYPFPSTARYVRNQAIDSAPESGTLVTGQRGGDGINVYRWDPETKTLNKIWAPSR